MGEVWATAQDVDELDIQKLIALKVLKTQELASNSAKLFFDEARTAAALNHAAIVPTIDFGRDGDILYIGMDLVRGPSLSALLQHLAINKSMMPPNAVALIGRQIAAALDYAHERATFEGRLIRLIHRDISPHNILIDLHGTPKLMDFGVARTAIQTHESRVGTVRGKPSYMSPEQIAGGELDSRSDVFALGVVLWESACLKRLFGRSNPVKSMEAVVRHDPNRVVDMVPGFPPELSAIIAKALEKDPTKRFQRPGELLAALNEANGSIPDAIAADRALSRLIETNFPPESFDIDRRVSEALALAAGQEVTRYTVVRTHIIERASDPPPQPTNVALLPTTVAWPTAPASDPLAPEAIEELRTAFAVRTADGMQVYGTVPMADGMPLLAGSSLGVPRSRASRWGVPMAATAAAMLIGTAAVVTKRNTPTEAPAIIETSEVPKQQVRAHAQPNAIAEDAPVLEAPPREVERGSTRRIASTTPHRPTQSERPSTEQEVRPAEPPTPSAPRKRDTPDATRAEVLELIRQVKAVNPEAAKKMFPTLNEAGEHNIEALNNLRREARRILALE